MIKPFAALANNAMLHKDLTQWLRNKTFSVLFFGLIFLAEALSLFFGLLPLERGNGGPIAFGFMSAILYVYAIIIAFSGYGLTAKEFQNRTFELFELSGMSLEKMIRGKLCSMLGQFLFGFFCVIPFMFFAYLLGGLDFYQILATALTLALLVAPLYLLALAVSLHSKQFKGGGALIRLVAGFFGVYMLIMFVNMLFFVSRTGRGPMGGGPAELLKQLFQLDPDALAGAAVFLGFYVQVCLLLFYLSCNAVAPPTDTREPQVKLFTTTLSLSLMGLAAWPMVKSGSDNMVAMLLGGFLLTGMCGVVYFWSPLEPPLMARKRQAAARLPFTRFFHYWFQAGPWGTFRVVLLYWLASWLLLWVGNMSLSRGQNEFLRLAALPLALPFYIAVPACFITRFRSLRTRALSNAMRTIILFYWILAGLGLMVATIILKESYRNLFSTAGEVLSFLSLIVSPISAFTCLSYRDSGVMENAPGILITLGVLGVPLMMRTIHGRALALRAMLPQAPDSKPSKVNASPEPRMQKPLPAKLTANAEAQAMEAAE